MLASILGSIIVGAIVGVVARLVRPGPQNLSMLETVLIGVVSAFVVGLILGLTTYKNSNGGIPWISWVLSVVVAVILIPVYEQLRGRSKA
ncbi:GlsB/YeaQ/YmgE family stress response membrane protein [Branchiibius cervicis]|uniref:GlsB/YeaQ/YmgE family stress response membrane protein n=1 Tax=Branchiibius cervicis TaxID=908252 RepID=A0ABW2AQY8_9MICO